MTDLNTFIQTVTVAAIPLLLALAWHEVAHAYAAKYFGDTTAADAGGLRLNPIHYIDPFGTIVLPLLTYWAFQIPLMYPKSTPVDLTRLRNPKKQMGFVAGAGPAANFVMGLVWGVMAVLLEVSGVTEPFLVGMAQAGVLINAVMVVLNMLPFPSFDGGTVLMSLLPMRAAIAFEALSKHRFAILMLVLFGMYAGLLTPVLSVLIRFVIAIFGMLLFPLSALLN